MNEVYMLETNGVVDFVSLEVLNQMKPLGPRTVAIRMFSSQKVTEMMEQKTKELTENIVNLDKDREFLLKTIASRDREIEQLQEENKKLKETSSNGYYRLTVIRNGCAQIAKTFNFSTKELAEKKKTDIETIFNQLQQDGLDEKVEVTLEHITFHK